MASVQRLPLIYSGRVRRALQMSEVAHRGQSRKSDPPAPYLLHPVAVASVLAAAGADDDLLCAGYLHDCPEDTDMTLTEIEDEFGSNVMRLVAAVTKDFPAGTSRDEKARATETAMSAAALDAVALKGADLLVNISDLVLDKRLLGYAHWEQVFKSRARAEAKVEHYLRLADVIVSRLEHAGDHLPLLTSHLRERAGELRSLFANWSA